MLFISSEKLLKIVSVCIRQSGIFSPVLFTVYTITDVLINQLRGGVLLE